jgi:SynChlorMet cassette protein ScmD
MKNNKTPIANPHVVLREEFDDWAILFDPDSGRGFGLSPTGAYVWKLLDGKHTSTRYLRRSASMLKTYTREQASISRHLSTRSLQRGLQGSTTATLALALTAGWAKLRLRGT